MNDFKGLSRDTSWVKTPSEMWHFARNILLTGQYLSVSNEKGTEYGYDIPGKVIGYAVTNEDIVYFSIDGSYSCIGYVNYLTETYKPVVRTMNTNFKFKHSCPIEAIVMYNYKKELITMFSDGVYKNSSSPKLVNLHKPQASLTSQFEFTDDDDYTMFELFNPVSLPAVSFNYEGGNLKTEVVHLAFCYVFEDDTESTISPIIATFYPRFKGINSEFRKIIFELSNLSPNFKKIKLFFVVHYDSAINGYVTPIIDIVNGSVSYTLASLERLDIVAPEQILIQSERFTKIKTITKTDNQALIGNVEQALIDNYQKYANKLKLKLNCLYHEDDMEKFKSHPTLLPDEVYSFKIVPIYLNGTKGNALHIPGRKAISGERDLVDEVEFRQIGLDFPEFFNKGYRRFHFQNNGILSMNNADNRFGYWENEDTYPNKDYYNSSDIGGEDLRGKPVRYHKIPTIEPDVHNHFSTEWITLASTELKDESGHKVTYMPKIYVTVDNFFEAFPKSITDKLQGYELIIEKRQLGGTYVETNGVLYRPLPLQGINYVKTVLPDGTDYAESTMFPYAYPRTFTNSFFTSAEVVRDSIEITGKLIKCYYAIPQIIYNEDITVDPNKRTIITIPPKLISRLAYIKKAEYKLANSIAMDNEYNPAVLALNLKEKNPTKRNHYDSIGFYEAQAMADGYPYEDDFMPLADFNNDNRPTSGGGAGNLHIRNLMISASIITLNKNIYNLDSANEFISLGLYVFKKYQNTIVPTGVEVAGDVFTTNIINKLFTGIAKVPPRDNIASTVNATYIRRLAIFTQSEFYLFNMYSPFSNHYFESGKGNVDKKPAYNSTYYNNWQIAFVNLLNSYNYGLTVKSKPVSNYFNTYVDTLPPGLTEKTINYFPYRVYKGLDIPTESMQTTNLRFFPTNSYYDMPNERGEIVALRGFNRGVYIQQRWSLYQSTIADKMSNNETEVYLGSSTLFDRIPVEIVDNSNIGYIGSNSQFASFVFRDGYIGVDEERGKIFIVNAETSEVSQRNIKNEFRTILPLGTHYTKKDLLDKKVKTDNPFLSVGYIVGFDEENNRILVTKKYYSPKASAKDLVFDGEFYYDKSNNIIDFNNETYFVNESRTFSYALDSKSWVCEHDYFPNAYLYNNKGFYGIINRDKKPAQFYKFNSSKVNNGLFFGKQYESYVDLIFNTRLDISKQYQAVYWVSESKDNISKRLEQYKTIDKIMVYNHYQCSGVIDISNNNLELTRNVESKWQFNEFRDMLIDADSRFLREDGSLDINKLTTNKLWFDRNMFIGNFIVTRLIWSNNDNRTTYVHNVNVKSINSNR